MSSSAIPSASVRRAISLLHTADRAPRCWPRSSMIAAPISAPRRLMAGTPSSSIGQAALGKQHWESRTLKRAIRCANNANRAVELAMDGGRRIAYRFWRARQTPFARRSEANALFKEPREHHDPAPGRAIRLAAGVDHLVPLASRSGDERHAAVEERRLDFSSDDHEGLCRQPLFAAALWRRGYRPRRVGRSALGGLGSRSFGDHRLCPLSAARRPQPAAPAGPPPAHAECLGAART